MVASDPHNSGSCSGSRPSGADLRSTYLLSGIAMCAWCEGSLVGLKRGMGRWKPYYLCVRHHHRGPEICANDLRITQDVLDDAFLSAVRRVFDPGMIREAIAKAADQLQAGRAILPDQRRQVERELLTCEDRIAHLVEAIGTGSDRVSVRRLAEAREPEGGAG